VDGRPAAETEEGRAWLEDQQARENWGPAVALMMRWGACRAVRLAVHMGRPRRARPGRTIPSPHLRPFGADRRRHCSTIHVCMKCPIGRSFDLERVRPEARRSSIYTGSGQSRQHPPSQRGGGNKAPGRAVLRSTTQSHFASVSSRCFGPERGQAAFEKYINLNAATSPSSELGQNIRKRKLPLHASRSKASFHRLFIGTEEVAIGRATTSSLRAP